MATIIISSATGTEVDIPVLKRDLEALGTVVEDITPPDGPTGATSVTLEGDISGALLLAAQALLDAHASQKDSKGIIIGKDKVIIKTENLGEICYEIASGQVWFMDSSGNLIPDGARNIGDALNPVDTIYVTNIIPAPGGGGGSSFPLSNNSWATWRNQSNSTDINVLKLNTDDNTVLNAITGKSVNFSINDSPQWKIEDGLVGASDGDLVYMNTVGYIRGNTSDGSDNGQLTLSGGGDGSPVSSRGGHVNIYGNDHSAAGSIELKAGATSTGKISFFTGLASSLERWSILESGNLIPNGNSTFNLGDASNHINTIFVDNIVGVSLGGGSPFPLANNTYATWRNSGDTADLNIILVDSTNRVFVGPGTIDGADSSQTQILGGGAASSARGGRLSVHGNEDGSNGGKISLVAGNALTGSIELHTTASTNSINFTTNNVLRWQIDGTSGHLIPQITNSLDLGSSSLRLRKIWANDIDIQSSIVANSIVNTGLYTGNDFVTSPSAPNFSFNTSSNGNHQFFTNGSLVFETAPNDNIAIRSATDNSWDLGSITNKWRDIFSYNFTLHNGGFLRGLNTGNSNQIDLIGINTSEDTIINTGYSGNFSSNIIFRTELGTERWKFNQPGHLLALQNNQFIGNDTSDTLDNQTLNIGGGGLALNSRGGFLQLHGNESSGTGKIQLRAGNVSGGSIEFYTSNALAMDIQGNLLRGAGNTLISTDTADGADTGVTFITGGGREVNSIQPAQQRGGAISLFGNEHPLLPGEVNIGSGDRGILGSTIGITSFGDSTTASPTGVVFITTGWDGASGFRWDFRGNGDIEPRSTINHNIGTPAGTSFAIGIGNIYHENDRYHYFKNAARTADIQVLGVNSSEDTILNCNSTRSILFQVAGTTEWSLDTTGNFVPNGNKTQDIGNASNHVKDVYLEQIILNGSDGEWRFQDISVNDTMQWVRNSANATNFRVQNTGVGGSFFQVGVTTITVPFTGVHRYLLASGETPNSGDAMYLDGVYLRVCTTASMANCIGIYANDAVTIDAGSAEQDSLGHKRFGGEVLHHIASVGDTRTRDLDGFNVCDENGNISEGDLLCTSSVSGHLMKQADDIIRSTTVGKSMEAIDFVALASSTATGIYGFVYSG